MCCDGKHPRLTVMVNFQAVILADQLDTMISSDGNFSDLVVKENGHF